MFSENDKNILYAHTSEKYPWQPLEEHSLNVAELCRNFVVPQLKDFAYWIGLQHDRGKGTARFQQHLQDPSIRTEHSLHGAKEAMSGIPHRCISLLAAQCIAGHHTGLPDTGVKGDHPEKSTLYARLARKLEPLEPDGEIPENVSLDVQTVLKYLVDDCTPEDNAGAVERIAFLTRYCFSALCDADSLDTMRFCNGGILPKIPHADFKQCLEHLEQKFASFECCTELQRARSRLQEQVYRHAETQGNVFLLNMPTGSGKTLCSMKFALQRAILHGRKRIIYVSGYNAIIDQTAGTLDDIFKTDAQIVRHQSTFSYDDVPEPDDEEKNKRIHACENWDAEMVVSTTVQFFESIAACSRGKLRRLHNLADSIILLDEIHTLPLEYLQPCLKAIALVTSCLNSDAIFMTATMPDYEKLLHTFGSQKLQVTDLIPDKSLYSAFRKCDFLWAGEMTDERLILQCTNAPSSLVIVNTKKTARELYENCSDKCKKFHLSTYMTAEDRTKTIKQIRKELYELEKAYPGLENVPPDERVICFSTSLVEAGVDLDFSCVFRELTALDSILQAGGRCNREGKRKDAKVVIFERSDIQRRHDTVESDITRSLLVEYPDISSEDCIREYYERLIFAKKDDLMLHAFSRYSKSPMDMNFRTYAENFHLIEDRTISIVVPTDKVGRELVECLRRGELVPERRLQSYTASITRWELDDLRKQGVIDDFGCGIYCLMNMDYYKSEVGIGFTGQDLFDS